MKNSALTVVERFSKPFPNPLGCDSAYFACDQFSLVPISWRRHICSSAFVISTGAVDSAFINSMDGVAKQNSIGQMC